MDTPSEQEVKRDPFLQRAVEHWLDSANELGYQSLFCEWLITKGYALKYSIKNTHFEQGKDVVAVAPNGVAHAYQLKGKNISLTRWRSEVKPEIDILIGGAIQHPEIDKSKPHVSYLVTNGEIEDNVRADIVSLNEGAWKDTPLHYWTRGDLLNGFQEMAEGILPKDAETYKKLIDLIFADGKGLPDLDKVNSFLAEILQISKNGVPKEQRRRDIAAAILYTTMIVGPYREQKNHVSVVQILTLLVSSILYLVDEFGLDDKYWFESYKIIWSDIIGTAKLLETEISTKGFDESFTSPLDSDLIGYRKQAAISIVYPLKLSQFISGDDEWKNMLKPEVSAQYKGAIGIWGEASLLSFIFLALIFKNFKGGEGAALTLLHGAVEAILATNGRKSKIKPGLVPPYFDINFIVKLHFGLLDEEFDDSYKFGSHLLKSLVELLVRAGDKDFIVKSWKEISFMHFEQFLPDMANGYYLRRCEKGINMTYLPKPQKSWKELETESATFGGNAMPKTLKRFPEFVPFFLAVFPHRADSETVGFLDVISSQKAV